MITHTISGSPTSCKTDLFCLAYAFITSIISNSLFLSGQRFDFEAAPYRGVALVGAILIALWSRSMVVGMLSGTLLALGLAWLR